MLRILPLIFFLSISIPALAQLEYVDSPDSENYLIHFPDGYTESQESYPVMIFLHGVGERGNGSEKDIQKVVIHGPLREIKEGDWDTSLPLIVIGPQMGGMLSFNWSKKTMDRVLEHVIANYRINPNRIYVTGLSSGGKGTWDFARYKGEQIAAIVPAGAWSNPFKKACAKVSHLGVWAFHGEDDPLISRKSGQKAVDNFNSCTPPVAYPGKLTVLPGAKHGSWSLVYENKHGGTNLGADGKEYSDIYRWMLTFSLENGPPVVGEEE